MTRSDDDEVLDSTAFQSLTAALDDAWRRVLAEGTRFDDHGEAACSVLARRINELRKLGERNHERLVQGALRELKIRPWAARLSILQPFEKPWRQAFCGAHRRPRQPQTPAR